MSRKGRSAKNDVTDKQPPSNKSAESEDEIYEDPAGSEPTLSNLYKLNTEMNVTLKFLSSQYDDFLRKVTRIEKENKTLKKQNEELNTRLEVVENEINMQQQQRIKDYITIHGIPHKSNENLKAVIIETVKATRTNITEENILSCRRMTTPNTTKTAIIVAKLDKYETKTIIQQNFKNNGPITMKQITPNINPAFEARLIYINDYLTNHTRQLYELAKQLKKKYKLRYAWTKDGKVFIRKNENSRILRIKNISDQEVIEENLKEQ